MVYHAKANHKKNSEDSFNIRQNILQNKYY